MLKSFYPIRRFYLKMIVQTTEKNGEISCSIEETNKLRISLGLKPLKLNKENKNKLNNNVKNIEIDLKKKQQDSTNQNKTNSILNSIKESRKKRIENQKLNDKTIVESIKLEEKYEKDQQKKFSAKDWVEKSRNLEKQKNNRKNKTDSLDLTIKKNKKEKFIPEIKLTHTLEDMMEGEEVIFTLKDTSVLQDDDTTKESNANEEILLENVNLAEIERKKSNERRKKRAEMPSYDVFDGTNDRNSQKNILSQYDDDEKETINKFSLNDLITKNNTSESNENKIVKNESLELIIKPILKSTDYYTNDELNEKSFQTFKKRDKKKKKKDKKEKSRKKRKVQTEKEEQFNEISPSILLNNKMNDHDNDNIIEEEDDDFDLMQSLSKTRQEAIKSRFNSKHEIKNEENRLSEFIMKEENIKNSTLSEDIIKKEKIDNHTTNNNKVILTEATDFEIRIKNALETKKEKIQNQKNIENKIKIKKEDKSTVKNEEDIITKNEKNEIDVFDDSNMTNEDEDWGYQQPLVGTGMGAALSVLKETGDLRPTEDLPTQCGRSNDYIDKSYNDYVVKDGVKLEYKDEYGRFLTKKEAFRLLSYKFHGHMPGKKKQEKKIMQIKQEIKNKKSLSSEGARNSMLLLNKKQKLSEKPYVVLSNK